MQDELDFFS